MATPILAITDGTTRVNLLTKNGSGINCCEYTPARPTTKGDGVWADSSISNGRQLQMRKWGNIIDIFSLKISGKDQDAIIQDARNLTELLEKASYYWTTEWQNEPVWIERRGSNETETSYSLIHGYKWENDDNPFNPPFYTPSKPMAMDGIDLAVEHGFWLANAPDEAEDIEISNLMIGEQTTISGNPAAQADDIYINYATKTASASATTIYLGEVSGGGFLFNNIAIPVGSVILEAYVSLEVVNNTTDANLNVRVSGERNVSPSQFSTYANYIGRTRTNATETWDQGSWAVGTIQNTSDISPIIQEIIDLDGWASGNDIVVFMEYESGSGQNTYAFYDHLTGAIPSLSITYANYDVGRNDTTENEVFISNKNNIYQIDYLYYYDASATSYTSLYGNALPYELFPSPPAANDILYIGSSSGIFHSVVFDLEVGSANFSTEWEYWDGAAWSDITDGPYAYSDPQINLMATDEVICVFWKGCDDWEIYDPAGTLPEAYWIRVKVTSVPAGVTTPKQQNRQPYTITRNSVDIDADQIGGDIPAYLGINLYSRYVADKVMFATRSLSRGEYFKPHINAVGQNHPSINISGGTEVDDTTNISATGNARRTTWGAEADPTLAWSIEIESALSSEYYGRYRAFARFMSTSAVDGLVQSYLEISLGKSVTTKQVSSILVETGEDHYYLDYGIITLPPTIIPEAYGGNIDIDIYAGNTFGALTVDWIDFILVPIDEFALQANITSGDYPSLLEIDSTYLIGKQKVFSFLRNSETDRIVDVPLIISPSEFIANANADIRLYVFQLEGYCFPGLSASITTKANERYLTFRGE